ncbi:hypothetical protein SUDANB106_02594 [Streptomyces sp. enrichment culture]|uniref:phosphotransferase n=1 Tax=Streptomyces sp. enrichment culture TaxID=1795815 RepID=UPI003F5487CA
MAHPSTFQGHHRIWHVVPGPGGRGWVKLAEPRDEVLWFDRRCFRSEEDLLAELGRHGVSRVPSARPVGAGGPAVQDFIAGRTLSEVSPAGEAVAEEHLAQILRRFSELARVRPEAVTAARRCSRRERVASPRSSKFLRGLIRFTRRRAYRARRPEYGRLFDRLGVPPRALGRTSRLWSEAGKLTPRPFCLLHGDLHRANLIVDGSGLLWTIDWELAMLGDPLYDLATHLYLMGYPPSQEGEVVERWRTTVEAVLPGAGAAAGQDLPRYLAYKRAQSVYTDVVRQARWLAGAGPAEYGERLSRVAGTVHGVLERAADALGMARVPGRGEVEAAYAAYAGHTASGRVKPRPGRPAPAPAPAPAVRAAAGAGASRPGGRAAGVTGSPPASLPASGGPPGRGGTGPRRLRPPPGRGA